MINYLWKIETTEYEIQTGGITVAHWRVTAKDGDYTASTYGTVSFTFDATDPDFKPYDQVSEADVLTWVWETVDKAETEENLVSQIDIQKNPTTEFGTPW